MPPSRRSSTIRQSAWRLRGSSPAGGFVEEQDLGTYDEAEGQVEPAPHAARVGGDAAAGGVGEVEAGEQLVGPRPRGAGAQAVQAAEHPQVLGAREQVVDGRELAREGDGAPHRHRVGDDVVPGDAHLTGVGRRQRGQDADERGLPGAVRAEQRVDPPRGHGKVDAVENHVVAEGLRQPTDGNCV